MGLSSAFYPSGANLDGFRGLCGGAGCPFHPPPTVAVLQFPDFTLIFCSGFCLPVSPGFLCGACDGAQADVVGPTHCRWREQCWRGGRTLVVRFVLGSCSVATLHAARVCHPLGVIPPCCLCIPGAAHAYRALLVRAMRRLCTSRSFAWRRFCVSPAACACRPCHPLPTRVTCCLHTFPSSAGLCHRHHGCTRSRVISGDGFRPPALPCPRVWWRGRCLVPSGG